VKCPEIQHIGTKLNTICQATLWFAGSSLCYKHWLFIFLKDSLNGVSATISRYGFEVQPILSNQCSWNFYRPAQCSSLAKTYFWI